MLVYIVFASGLCSQLFVRYGINYLFILEIDPNHKITHMTLFRVALTLFFISCFTLTLAEIKLQYLF